MEAWNSDPNDGKGGDNLIDKIIILDMETIDFMQSNIRTVEGEEGIGNFTLIYYNLIINTTACSSTNPPPSTTSPTPKGRLYTSRYYIIVEKNFINTSSFNLLEHTRTK